MVRIRPDVHRSYVKHDLRLQRRAEDEISDVSAAKTRRENIENGIAATLPARTRAILRQVDIAQSVKFSAVINTAQPWANHQHSAAVISTAQPWAKSDAIIRKPRRSHTAALQPAKLSILMTRYNDYNTRG